MHSGPHSISVPGCSSPSFLQSLSIREHKNAIALVVRLLLTGSTTLVAQDQTKLTSHVHIVIVEGAGAINNIRTRTAREVIVQVEDDNHRPIADASLTVFLPQGGSSGTFATGGQTFYGTSGANGQAAFDNFSRILGIGGNKWKYRTNLILML